MPCVAAPATIAPAAGRGDGVLREGTDVRGAYLIEPAVAEALDGAGPIRAVSAPHARRCGVDDARHELGERRSSERSLKVRRTDAELGQYQVGDRPGRDVSGH